MEAPKKIYIHRSAHLGLLEATELNVTGQDVMYTRSDLTELTPADIARLLSIAAFAKIDYKEYSKEYYNAVLRKFKEYKNL